MKRKLTKNEMQSLAQEVAGNLVAWSFCILSFVGGVLLLVDGGTLRSVVGILLIMSGTFLVLFSISTYRARRLN